MAADKAVVVFEKSVEVEAGRLSRARFSSRLSARAWRILYRFGVYQRLFAIVCLANLVVLATTLSAQFADLELLDRSTTAAAANLVLAIVIRQESVINTFFAVCWSVPKWTPLWVRCHLAKVYEFGGIHSGAATCALGWFSLLSAYITKCFVNGLLRNVAILVLDYAMLLLLAAIVLSAVPAFRVLYHNLFERVHRFAGWSLFGLFWALLLVYTFHISALQGLSPGSLLVKTPSFWLAVVATFLTILPWVRLRKVVVRPDPLSSHAIRLHLDYHVPMFQGVAISYSPLSQWHAFASFPDADGAGSSVLISKAGDWTTQTIQAPRDHYYIKGFPRTGVLAMARLFRCIVFVATGSGIGPLLAVAMHLDSTQTHVIWSTPTTRERYGEEICVMLTKTDPAARIIDTQATVRPDLVQVAFDAYQALGAEAVFCVSNKPVTRKVLWELRERNVPAFAPIFDS